MAEPLIAVSVVATWEARLRKACEVALDSQVGSINRTLRAQGLPAHLTASTKKRKAAGAALGTVVVANVWNQPNWIQLVDLHIAPVAAAVAGAAVGYAAGKVGTSAMWGRATSQDAITSSITNAAVRSGAAIGARADAAGIADDDILSGITDALASAPNILGDLIGAMANMASTVASQDAASGYAAQVTSLDDPAYLSATKNWENAGDDKVREAHLDVDPVAINEYFTVGGEPMIGPGDPQASDENTANCRCICTYDGIVPEGSGYDTDPPQYQGEAA